MNEQQVQRMFQAIDHSREIQEAQQAALLLTPAQRYQKAKRFVESCRTLHSFESDTGIERTVVDLDGQTWYWSDSKLEYPYDEWSLTRA